MKRTIAILEAGPIAADLAARYGSYGDCFERFLCPRDTNVSFPVYRLYRGELPAGPEAADAFLITGSRYSATDDLPWIAPAMGFARALGAARRPLVGVCFGHQLIAAAFGGRVAKAAQGWGIGVHRYRVAAARPWMDPAMTEFALLASHQDQVTAAPPGAEVLAGNAFCPIGMLQIGASVMTLQSHPELGADFAAEIYRMRRQVIGAEAVDRALAGLDDARHEPEIRDWFLRFLIGRAGPGGRPGAAPAPHC